MRKIIADTSSLILLYKCGGIKLLLDKCICVVPETVMAELTVPEREGSFFFAECAGRGSLTVEKPSDRTSSGRKMDNGEDDVISLYEEGSGDYILIDDGRGAAYCRDNGIPYINALLTVKLIFLAGLIPEQEMEKIASWLKINGRYSESVILWAENAGAEKLKDFLLHQSD